MTDLENGRRSLFFTSHKKADFQLCQQPKTKEIVVEDQPMWVQSKKNTQNTTEQSPQGTQR